MLPPSSSTVLALAMLRRLPPLDVRPTVDCPGDGSWNDGRAYVGRGARASIVWLARALERSNEVGCELAWSYELAWSNELGCEIAWSNELGRGLELDLELAARLGAREAPPPAHDCPPLLELL